MGGGGERKKSKQANINSRKIMRTERSNYSSRTPASMRMLTHTGRGQKGRPTLGQAKPWRQHSMGRGILADVHIWQVWRDGILRNMVQQCVVTCVRPT